MGDTPNYFICPNERRQRNYAYSYRARRSMYTVPSHEVVRTGRVKKHTKRRGHYGRSLMESHEYRCTRCKHIGWTRLSGILQFPLERGSE